MTTVSSDVTMTAFEPVLVACSAYKSKRVSASSCVDCSSATSTHSSAVILVQVSSQVTYNALSCSISLYHCSFHSPPRTWRGSSCWRNCTGIVSTIYVVSPCRHLYWMVVIAPRFSLSEYLHDGRLAVYVKDNINLTTLSTNISTTNLDARVCVCVCKIWPISARRPTLSFRHKTSRNFFSHSNFPIPYLWTAFCVPLSFVFLRKTII